MKKSLITFLCIVFMLFLGSSVHAETTTVTGTVVVPDSITIPQEGLTVKVYAGYYAPLAGGAHPDYFGYHTLPYQVPTPTIYEDKQNVKSSSIDVTIPYGEKSAPFAIDFYNPYSFSSVRIGYIVNTDTYIGAGMQKADETNTLEISCKKSAVINGTITVPKQDERLLYAVVAEKNRRAVNNDGYFDTKYDFVNVSYGEFLEGETSATYSLSVEEGSDYTVYIRFYNNQEYKSYGYSDITATQEKPATVNFKSLSKSKKITGTVKLPEGVEIEYFNNSLYDYIDVKIALQSTKEPHYIIDSCHAKIYPETRSADFELYDNLGNEDCIIYFEIYDRDIKNIYSGGYYKNNRESTPNINEAKVFVPKNQSITLNLIKANILHMSFDRSAPYDLHVIPQSDKNTVTGYDDSDIAIDICAEREDNDIYMNIPEMYDSFILDYKIVDNYDDDKPYDLYLSDQGFTKSLQTAKVISITEDTDLNVSFDGIEPFIPITVKIQDSYINGENYTYDMYLFDSGYFPKDNLKQYVVLYKDGEITKIISDPFSIGVIAEPSINIPIEDYESADEIYLYYWKGMVAQSEKFKLK